MLCYEPDHWVLLFPTKEHWRNPSRMEYIEAGLSKFCRTYAEKGITSIAFPRLGCGSGELSWSDVQPLMEKYLKELPIDIYIYLGTGPDPVPKHRIQEKTVDWLRQNAKDMSFQGLCNDIRNNSLTVPFCFSSDRHEWTVMRREGLVFNEKDQEAEPVLVSDDEFYDIWSGLRMNGTAAKERAGSCQRLVQDLLLALGYVSEIRIYDKRTGEKTDGLQIDAGAGRIYALKGRPDES